MRARGAQVTDIAILVVAADDGVKPQTIEALNHAQAADVPIVVAVNKIDKEGADPAKVRGQLTEYGLVAEEYGGDTMFVDVSAKPGIGIDELLEAVLLTADAALDLRANPNQDAAGCRHRGAPRPWSWSGRDRPRPARHAARRRLDRRRRRVRSRPRDARRARRDRRGGRPVASGQVLGLTSRPRRRRQLPRRRRGPHRPADRRAPLGARAQRPAGRAAVVAGRSRTIFEPMEKGEVQQLNLILKGDVSGSVEALEDALLKIDVGDEVTLRIIDRGVGAITENNVNLAVASDAVIIGFNVRAEGKARELADREGVDVRYYSVIYQAIDEVEAALKGMLKPEFEEAQLGTAEIREVFRSSQVRQHRRLPRPLRHHRAQLARRGWSATASSSRTTSPSTR